MEQESVARKSLSSCKRAVVKVGTGVLTSPDGSLDLNVMRNLCTDIAALHKQGKQIALVTSGAIGAGKAQLGIDGKGMGLDLQQASAAVGQSILMEQYNGFFARHGLKVAQILLVQEDFSEKARGENLSRTIEKLFSLGVLPIINENDAVSTDELDSSSGRDEKLFGDNDTLSALLCSRIGAQALVILSNVDGLLGKDGAPIGFVNKVDGDALSLDNGETSGRGGMQSKLKSIGRACGAGAIGIIANGKSQGVLAQIFSGKQLGTVFPSNRVQEAPSSPSGAGKMAAQKAQECGNALRLSPQEKLDSALIRAATLIGENKNAILDANKKDMEEAKKGGANEAFLSRLKVDGKGVEYLSSVLRNVAAINLPPKTLQTFTTGGGLEIKKVRVPLGAICVIFESRPDVAVEASALAIKSGNSIVLKSGHEAKRTVEAAVSLIKRALLECGLPQDAVQVFSGPRSELAMLLKESGKLELVVPRGSEGLLKFVRENSEVPAIFAGGGNCHIYVHSDADFAMAEAIAVNAKVQKPSACNAIETMLVHRSIAKKFLIGAAKKLVALGVELRCCPESHAILAGAGIAAKPAVEADWGTEFLSLILAVKVVGGIPEATAHINKYSTRHSEAIISASKDAYMEFSNSVDASAVYWNASTRFTDGAQFGFGAELGISTQKLHARGPLGLDALFTYKYEIIGKGQIRE
jgi:gamma-glutamyl phosphate reductase/glutamate 5-kinase